MNRHPARNRKAILFGVFVTHGTRTAMELANNQLKSPCKPSTLRAWFNRWRRLPWQAVMSRFGKY
jgi:hypothetical protein